jgi:hypothetical protein
VQTDTPYDISPLYRALRARGITRRIARRGIDSSDRLGRNCCEVERSLSWLLGFRRLGLRYERRADGLRGVLRVTRELFRARFLASPTGA